jgi:hypothetical protein
MGESKGGGFPEERATGIICEACGGEGRRLYETTRGYRAMACKWCSDGVMTPGQLRAWRMRKKTP